MNFLRILILTLLLVASQNLVSLAQEETPRTIGLSAVVQTSHFDVMLPLWISPRTLLAPAISALVVSSAGTDLGFALVPRFYTHLPEGLTPYFSLRLGSIFGLSRNTGSTTDVISGIAFGGEYFFSPKFSIGVETQLNATFSDSESTRFGNPGGTNINTGTAILANIYF